MENQHWLMRFYVKRCVPNCIILKKSPVNIECAVEKVIKLGSHDMFIGRVLAVDVEARFIDERGRFSLDKCKLTAYSHGEYYALGKLLGSFGYSVRKKD